MISRYLALALCLSTPAFADSNGDAETLKHANEAAALGDFQKASELLKSAAKNGNPDAAFQLGEFYLNGHGVTISIPQALEWYQLGAEKNHALSHLRLGEIYLRGISGIEPDQDRGLFHLQSAAESGLPEAFTVLGNLAQSNARAADAKPERDRLFKEARDYFEKAVAQDDPGSQLALAFLLDTGEGGNPDPTRAISLIKKAALAGNAQAMNELGLRHQTGKGVPKDAVTALGWFVAGAERNDPAAMTNLGTCYSRGIILPANHDKAGAWYARASKLGYAPAQYFLGEAFEKGLGTQPNPVFAFVNYSHAARADHAKAAEALEALEPKLTPSQKEEAFEILNKEK